MSGDGAWPKVDRVLHCTHPDYLRPPFSIDIGEFWEGASDVKTGLGARDWAGGFRGRPALADTLYPSLKLRVDGFSPPSLRAAVSNMRTFFRFLDVYERAFGTAIECLEDIRSSLSVLWLTPPPETWSYPSRTPFEFAGRVILDARQLHDCRDPFVWQAYPHVDPVNRADLPSEEEGREMLHELKRRAHTIYARWDAADRMAQTGRNLLVQPRRSTWRHRVFGFAPTIADAHATYRALIAVTGDPLPDFRVMNRALGLGDYRRAPHWWPKSDSGKRVQVTLEELAAGLYPTNDDLYCLSNLYMARSGWNPSTVYAIDTASDDWAQLHGDAATDLYYIQSFKERSSSWQDTISPGKHSTGCYQIVRRLLERTQPLRALIARSPERCNAPAIAARSPWLAGTFGGRSGNVSVLTPANDGGRYLRRVIREHNASEAKPRVIIPESFKPSDFRDILAGFTFRDSRYSWILTQWMLGHKHLRTTRRYLRSLAWRKHSEQALTKLMTIVVDEIEVHRRLDITIVKARSDLDHVVTADDRSRLGVHRVQVSERDLTYVGMLCQSPLLPPPAIDPTNPRDGNHVCQQGHRCASCPSGQVFDGSLPYLSRRLAELRYLSGKTNAVVWAESDYAMDLDVLNRTLTQWPENEVAQHVDFWKGEIEAGRHRVLRFGGEF